VGLIGPGGAGYDRRDVQMTHDLRQVASNFCIAGVFVDAVPYGSGHINDTYAVTFRQDCGWKRYILQRVNHMIFKDVPRLMDNIQRVTEHVRGKLLGIDGSDPERETLTVIPTVSGAPYHRDPRGNYWRAYMFIEDARTYDSVQRGSQAYEAARAFGTFQHFLLDLPSPPLHETIPDFHHTPRRFEKLEAAIGADTHNRARTAAAEIEFALARKSETGTLVDLLESGDLPARVTHNDTKINNVMLNDADGAGICVIDLDTVMPGTVLYDFGDQVRTTTATAAEDERDLSKVQFRLDMFESLVHGYLDAARAFLVPSELKHLGFCGRLITFEIGIRFLTDFLEGDVYFKTHRDGHNLDRCRTQFEMVRQMESQSEAVEEIVARYR
jgi:hypothetical protein